MVVKDNHARMTLFCKKKAQDSNANMKINEQSVMYHLMLCFSKYLCELLRPKRADGNHFVVN